MSIGASQRRDEGPDGGAHSALMDGIYRRQRHIYDATRKYYLFGRDRLIAELSPRSGDRVLEIGCGTGRNLIVAARRYPSALFYGIDISEAMLETARANVERAGLADHITLRQADATDFDPEALFSIAGFERVYVSYALSMIPGWQAALSKAFATLAPGGRLHVVDFGQQERLPRQALRLLSAWLAKFHVTPRPDLSAVFEVEARRVGADSTFAPIHRGYAWMLVAERESLSR